MSKTTVRAAAIAGLGCLVLLLFMPSVASAQFSLNQDTPTGHYSYWLGHKPQANGSLTARVTVKEIRGDSNWAPFVAFQIESAGSPLDRARVTFAFDTSPGSADAVSIEKGKTVSTINIPGEFRLKTPFDVSIQWAAGRSFEVSVNRGPPRQLSAPFTPAQIRILSGSADVDIENVQLK